MMHVDPFSGYTLCGAGALVSSALVAMSRPDDESLRKGIAACCLGLLVVGLTFLQPVFGPVDPPPWTMVCVAAGSVLGAALLGDSFRMLVGQCSCTGVILPLAPLIVLTLGAARWKGLFELAVVTEGAMLFVTSWVAWSLRSFLLQSHRRAEQTTAWLFIVHSLGWSANLVCTAWQPHLEPAPHLIYFDEPMRTVLAVAYGITPLLTAALAMNIVNAALVRRLRRHAMTDELTGLASRRALADGAQQVCREARKRQELLAVMMLDLDHFKSINDRFGHPVGDEVLRHAARTILSSLRDDALAVRFGGEEFLVLTRIPSVGAARRIADRLRQAIADAPCKAGAHRVPLTVSVGLAFWQAREPMEAALQRADEALYRAKEAGRNRVVTGTAELLEA